MAGVWIRLGLHHIQQTRHMRILESAWASTKDLHSRTAAVVLSEHIMRVATDLEVIRKEVDDVPPQQHCWTHHVRAQLQDSNKVMDAFERRSSGGVTIL